MQEQRDKIQLERHTRKILQHLRTRPDVFSLRAVHAPVRVLEKAQAKVSQPSTLMSAKDAQRDLQSYFSALYHQERKCWQRSAPRPSALQALLPPPPPALHTLLWTSIASIAFDAICQHSRMPYASIAMPYASIAFDARCQHCTKALPHSASNSLFTLHPSWFRVSGLGSRV